MRDAYVFEAIRTPRGKGKKDGSLHEVKPVNLLAGLLRTLQDRVRLDTAAVDDVVMGVVSPVGEQGSVIAKVAALKAGWDWRCAGVQINRFCASGLEAVNLAAMKVRSGWEELVVAGGVESMSRVPIGSDGGAWAQDPETNSATLFVPQGIGADLIATLHGFSREDLDTYAVASQHRAAAARAAGYFRDAVVPVTDAMGLSILEEDEFLKPGTTLEGLLAARLQPREVGLQAVDQGAVHHLGHRVTRGAALGRGPGARMVHQHAAHRMRRDREQVGRGGEFRRVTVGQAKERLAHDGGRLQGVAGALLAHQGRCHRAKLGVDLPEGVGNGTDPRGRPRCGTAKSFLFLSLD